MRDTQRKRVYTAEKEAFKGYYFGEQFTFRELGQYIELVKQSKYYTSQKGWKSVKLERSCILNACYFPSTKRVQFNTRCRTRHIVCHEMAHALAHKTTNDKDVGHHASFCTHYANLVAEMIGIDEAVKLIKSFDEHKVLYRPKLLTFSKTDTGDTVPMPTFKS